MLTVPANALPIMETIQLGRSSENTIAGGVLLLIHHGSWAIAAVILVASLLVPLAKILGISWLCRAVLRAEDTSPHTLHRLHSVAELLGKWSMIDVFVVALLVALVQVEGLLSMRPGPGALASAGVVLATMLAARSFDERLLWDRSGG